MFCKKCGRPTGNDDIICSECSAFDSLLTENATFDQGDSAPVQDDAKSAFETPKDVYPDLSASKVSFDDTFELNTEGVVTPAKKPVGKIIALISGCLVLIAALVIGLNWNKIFKPYDTPEEHLAYVESEEADAAIDMATSAYGNLLNTLVGNNSKSTGSSTQMHIKLSDDAIDMVSSFSGVDIEWASDILINLDTASSGQIMQTIMGIGLEDTTIASADVIMDFEEFVMYIGIPELSKEYLEFPLEDLFAGYYTPVKNNNVNLANVSSNRTSFDMEEYTEFLKTLPTEQELNEILKKYYGVIFKAFGEVESTSKTITVDGVSQKCTALTTSFNEEKIYSIFLEVLNTAKSDEDLINIILRVANSDYLDLDIDEDDIVDKIDDAIDEIEDDIDEIEDDDIIFELTDYVDSDEKIIGRRLEIEETDDEIYYMTATNKGKFAFEACFGDVMITGNGTEKKSVIDGEYVIEVSEEEICSVELIGWNSKSWKTGNAVGTIRIRPNEDLIQQFMSSQIGFGLRWDIALELVFNHSASKKHTEINILMDDDFFAGITFDSTENNKSKIELPDDTIDATDLSELEDWVQDFDFDNLLDNMKDAGVPREYIDLIEDRLDYLF